MGIRSLKDTDGDEDRGDVNVAGDVDGTRHENEDGALPTHGPNVDACLWVGAHWAEKLVLLDQGWTREQGRSLGRMRARWVSSQWPPTQEAESSLLGHPLLAPPQALKGSNPWGPTHPQDTEKKSNGVTLLLKTRQSITQCCP